MKDRFNFRAIITVSYYDENGQGVEKQLLLDSVVIYGSSQIGIEYDRLEDIIRKNIPNSRNQEQALQYIEDNNLCSDDSWVVFDADIIEQCTGLKDKNGKLIYEGDIIKIPDDYEEYGQMSGETRAVYFNEGGFRLKPKWNKNARGQWLEDTGDLEILGNIHENLGLLGVKDVKKC